MARSEGWGRNIRNVGATGSNPVTSTDQQPLPRKGCSLFRPRRSTAPILVPRDVELGMVRLSTRCLHEVSV